MDLRSINLLKEHVSARRPQTGVDKTLLGILSQMADDGSQIVQDQSSSSVTTEQSDYYNAYQWQLPDNPTTEDSDSPETGSISDKKHSEDHVYGSQQSVLQRSTECAQREETASFPEQHRPIPGFQSAALVRQPGDFNNKFKAVAEIHHHTQKYYRGKLYEHLQSDEWITQLTENRQCWTKVKNAIYYLKTERKSGTSNQFMARQELCQAELLIPSVVAMQPFPLLQDIFATLAPAAMPGLAYLRQQILKTFAQAAAKHLRPLHPFRRIIALIASDDEGSDDLSMTSLKAMLDASAALPVQHPEIFELRRSLIRLCRRMRRFGSAEDLAGRLIQDSVGLRRRLAVTELVYILKDQNRLDEALDLARSVLQLAEVELGAGYPDAKAIYAMEDVAEICDTMGKLDDSLMWLRLAFQASFTKIGAEQSTWHIYEKLEQLRDKRERLAMASVFP